jgi:hypothetical protein
MDALRMVDSRVQYNSPALHKETKPYLGVLFAIPNTNIEYFVPLSSPKAKYAAKESTSTFHRIFGTNGKFLASMHFNNMIPVVPELYETIDIANDKKRALLYQEYLFCRKNEKLLSDKAIALYKRERNNALDPWERKVTCNFRALEKKLLRYLAKNEAKRIETDRKTQSDAEKSVAITDTLDDDDTRKR